MRFNFRRIISRGKFIPEIDGLRFIAIVSVVLFHIRGDIRKKDFHEYHSILPFEDGLDQLIKMGHYGVPLFFVISGFILAIPFLKMYLKGGKPVALSAYFTRRLTRLEPPYIVAMTLLFFGAVYVAKTSTFTEAAWSYLASITYTHNFFYGKEVLPILNSVAWSLEVEVQFYLLMPVLASLFFRQNVALRRGGLILASLGFIVFDTFVELPFISLINYAEYFLLGILLADMYVSESRLFAPTRFDWLLSLFLFAGLWLFETGDIDSPAYRILWEVSQLLIIFLFYYLVLFHKSVKLLAKPFVTDVGGMCYSIYLIHFPLISIVGTQLMKYAFFDNSTLNKITYTVILMFAVLVVSSVFYLLIERPCMDKNWHKKLLARFREPQLSEQS